MFYQQRPKLISPGDIGVDPQCQISSKFIW